MVSHEDDVKRAQEALERRLEELLPAGEQMGQVYAAMRDGTLGTGKRMRPLLLVLTARDMGCALEQPGLLDMACAVEMVHAASLMLDDMPCMDNALLRRGRATIHCQYGENVAILAAVSLLSHAFGVISRTPALPGEAKSRAIAELATAIGHLGLAQGQFLDLSEGDRARDAEAIILTNTLKTSSLFDATLQMAAIAASASPGVQERLRCFARDMGQAFQLMDDLADGLNSTGKDPHKDRGKSTLVAMLGADAVCQKLHDHLHSADEHIAHACHTGSVTRRFLHAWFDNQMSLIRQNGPLSTTGCP
ncbi:polyprenyl synthetase family protein [Pseudenterobacter timonensis]|uniref:Polyprenyl synthetase family protein n=1 Tax=Pseudenterobacter timonensis TaxID=1755099 RepID=A0ABV4AB90_9ENTR